MTRPELVLVTLLALPTACGSGGDGTPEPTETALAQPTETVAEATETAGVAVASAFCEESGQQLDLLGRLYDQLRSGDEAQMQQLHDELRANTDQLVSSAPPEIGDDVQSIAAAMTALADSLGPGGPPPAEVAQIIASPGVQTAGNNLREYTRSTCGLSTTQTEGR